MDGFKRSRPALRGGVSTGWYRNAIPALYPALFSTAGTKITAGSENPIYKLVKLLKAVSR